MKINGGLIIPGFKQAKQMLELGNYIAESYISESKSRLTQDLPDREL